MKSTNEISPATAPDNACESDPWLTLIDALPPELHNRMHGVSLLCDPRWVAVEEREQALFAKAGRGERRKALRYLVEGVNREATGAPEWGAEMLRAVSGFDVDMVREMLAAGVRADQLFCDEEGSRWDLVSWALFVYAERARLFDHAAAMWAAKCSEIVTLAVRAGCTTWVNAWLGAEVAPVLALLESEAITLTGLESWQELGTELEWTEGMGREDVFVGMLEDRGLLFGEALAFVDDAAQGRFEEALDAWLDGAAE